MNNLSNKSKGQLVEAKFQYLALENKLNISIPFGDNLPYDLIVDNNKCLYKIQIKSTFTNKSKNHYQVKTCNGSKTSKSIYTNKQIDFLVAYINKTKDWYIVPVNEISGAVLDVFPNVINSRGKYEKFKNAWNLLS